MKNQLTELFDNMSDEDLLLAIKEVKESDVTGYIPLEGKISKIELSKLKQILEILNK